MSDDLFRNIMGKEMGDFEPKKDQTVQKKLDALNHVQKIQEKQLTSEGLSITDARELSQTIASNKLPEYNNLMVSMLLNMKNSILDAVLIDLIKILQSELNGDLGIDVSFLIQLLGRIDTLSKDSLNHEYGRIIQQLLPEYLNKIEDDGLKLKIQQIMRGINQLDAARNNEFNVDKKQQDPLELPKSSNVDILGASNKIQMPGLDGLDDIVFEKNSMLTNDQSIKIEQPSHNALTADILIQNNERSVGFAKAFGTLNHKDITKELGVFISAIIQIANLQPLFVISPVVSQMLVEIGRLVEDSNLFKVAIVTDHVASLLDIDPLDYVRKVKASDDSHYSVYEEYKQLYEDGYHFIISLHLNQNLKKSYSAALSAKKYIDEQKIKGLEIHVYNTNANGVGLGLMISELVEAIKNNYSPVEVNKLTKQLVNNYRHWVCPLEFDFVKNHQWVMKLADNQKKVQMRLFHFIPVIELDKKLTIVTVSYTKEAAFSTLISAMDDALLLEKRKINRICVEYRGVYREAIKIRNQIKVKYPSVKVSLQSVGSLTTKFFGPELVGICII